MRYVYTGPSWAKSSFPLDDDSTNLAKLWKIPHIDCSQFGSSVLNRLRAIKHYSNLPVIWVYNEPLSDMQEITGMSPADLLVNQQWKKHREDCNQYCLEQISKLNRPILLIGGHSDVENCNFANIRVAHPSWQKFIAKQAGLNVNDGTITGTFDSGTEFKVNQCWGAEIMHRHMFERPSTNPVHSLVESIWDTFFFWKEIDRLGWFHDVHPNRQATESFAEYLLPTVIDFLEDTK